MAKQLALFKCPPAPLTHGGARRTGRRKVRRPLYTKNAIHLVMKAKCANGASSLWHRSHRRQIENLIRRKARENWVQILDAVNMGNHLHLKIRIKDRKSFQRFLRTVTGLIARIVLKSEKGRASPLRFWDSLAYTRVLRTAIEELQLLGYFKANRIERERGYGAREVVLNGWNAWIQSLKTRPKGKTERPD